jgi:hypothetical protein
MVSAMREVAGRWAGKIGRPGLFVRLFDCIDILARRLTVTTCLAFTWESTMFVEPLECASFVPSLEPY